MSEKTICKHCGKEIYAHFNVSSSVWLHKDGYRECTFFATPAVAAPGREKEGD